MEKTLIKGFEFAQIYAVDYDKSVRFFEKYFRFKIEFTMPDGSCWGKAGDVGLWIGGGYEKTNSNERSVRCTVMMRIDSSHKLFNRLKEDGIKLFQKQPQEMQPGTFWFQFEDPSGNIIETLGDK